MNITTDRESTRSRGLARQRRRITPQELQKADGGTDNFVFNFSERLRWPEKRNIRREALRMRGIVMVTNALGKPSQARAREDQEKAQRVQGLRRNVSLLKAEHKVEKEAKGKEPQQGLSSERRRRTCAVPNRLVPIRYPGKQRQTYHSLTLGGSPGYRLGPLGTL
ncbi:hypothetical protein K438DRAFT_1782359 [Mycena galopus ATCC 62051]|nr:hypothetical protein K438DRAFT_1782359 [Mycena galopus ATCC 62051]